MLGAFLFLLSVLSFIGAALLFTDGRGNPVREIGAFILVVVASVHLVGAAIVDRLDTIRKLLAEREIDR